VLKEKITEQPILVLPEFKKTFQGKCDASGVAIGTILNQDDNTTFFYFSEKMNDAMKKYSTYEKKFYAIIQGLKKWRYYLLPKEFIMYTDNHALPFITR